MTYYIGIDGGGTKTEGVLTSSEGALLARALCSSTNPNDVTPEISVARLTELVRTLLTASGLTEEALAETSLFFGVAGGINHGPTLEVALRSAFPAAKHLRVRSDAHILLSGELPEGDGACIICGTGSVCFLRRGEELVRIGGWGYLLDSGGSGYDLGRDALEAALRAFDGRGEATLLTDLLTERLGGAVNTRITDIYREGKPYIAACAPLVFEAAEAGDTVANAILRRNARKLAEYIETAWRHLRTDPSTESALLPVVMGGGISQKASPLWAELVASLVEPTVPVRITVASAPPVFGAVAEAAKQAAEGIPVDYSALRDAFVSSYTL
jgi:N-acetylglucosamine kinase-like BadF-type ATPase